MYILTATISIAAELLVILYLTQTTKIHSNNKNTNEVQGGGALTLAGYDPTLSPPRCTKYSSQRTNVQSTNFILFDVALKLYVQFTP